MTEVSIIIPLYKGKKYLNCLKRMIQENIKFLQSAIDIQVVFVNDYPDEAINEIDCVIDGCACKLVVHDENKGIHRARISGINVADGKYIIMLDQDDLVRPDWIYSQWKNIEKNGYDICICNGWKRRFATLWNFKQMNEKINSLNYFLEKGNQILSPGQAIIKRDIIPDEWYLYSIDINGADDYYLWLLALKKGLFFGLNNEYLYFHTPERTLDSVSLNNMNKSRKEVLKKLKTLDVFSNGELQILEQYVNSNALSISADKAFQMFHIMNNWHIMTNRKMSITSFIAEKGYKKIAIYGVSYIGERLYEEFEMNNIEVAYGIDAQARDFNNELQIYCVEDKLPKVDLVIVTIVGDEEVYKNNIASKIDCDVLSINEIIIRALNGED